MKKFLCLLLCGLILSGLPFPARAEEPVSVGSRQQLEAMAENPGGSYRLDADIDLGEEDWTPIPFSGTLDGNGHTLYNLTVRSAGAETAVTVDGNCKEYDTVFAGLFSTLEDALVRNLQILGADVSVDEDRHCQVGILAGYLMHSRVENCRIEGRGALRSTNVMAGLGGLAGFAVGEIENCQVSVELTIADRREQGKLPKCEQFLGGLVSAGNTIMENNRAEIQGFGSCWGFAHCGGLIGMQYCYSPGDPWGRVCNNQVSGSIHFFENNTVRRAYCAPFVGEALPPTATVEHNIHSFVRDEHRGETEELLPNPCRNPRYEDRIIPHTDTEWGYTLHQCRTCDYSYKSDYRAPGHLPGEWIQIRESTYTQPGQKVRRCRVCNAVVEQEALPMLVPVVSCGLSRQELTLHYKQKELLTCAPQPRDAARKDVLWESSDPAVVTVDQDGNLTANKRGTAIVTCRSADGFAKEQCTVTVDFSPSQWLIEILLLGWIWY